MDHHKEQIGPMGMKIMVEEIYKFCYDREIKMEIYGKPYKFNYDYAEDVLRKRAAK